MSENIEHKNLHEVMGKGYIDYSMSVITDRALPDVRDGLKPVQRRILWAMWELNNTPDKPHRKCARIVGDTMGRFHPHGDSSIYGALVCMGQPFYMNNVLVDAHGNFGNIDGDGAAAMRYTEARLSKISLEMLRDIDSNTVDMVPNFDNSEEEPLILPARFPNFLVNGTQGIAVGMASNVPPHNLGETIDGCIMMLDGKLDGKDVSIDELLTVIKGPDFPTDGCILGNSYRDIYYTGKGSIVMDSVYHIEPNGKGKENIVIDEIPFRVVKSDLVKAIADRCKDAKLDVSDVRDETSKEGLRIVLELKKGAISDLIINDLKKHTALRSNFNANMLCIVNGRPMCLNLHDILKYYLEHQEEVVTRRTEFELKKAQAREHIVKGLLLAIDNIDEIIALIKSASDTEAAKAAISNRFGFSEAQAQYIVEMKLKSLSGLETEKLKKELEELEKKINLCQKILGNEKELLKVIRKELLDTKKKYATPRRTKHIIDYSDITMEDVIADEPVVIMRSKLGYIKRLSPEQFRTQKKGGRGAKGISTIDNDYITNIITTTTHANILFFSTKGKMYSLKAYQVPENGKNSRGTALVSLLKLDSEESVTDMFTAKKEADETDFVLLVTKDGMVKRMKLNEFRNIRSNGLIVSKLKDGDVVCNSLIVKEEDDVMLITKHGYCLCYPVSNVRAMGRVATGVHGIKLTDGDEVVSVQKQVKEKEILVTTSNGYAKRVSSADFKTFKARNGKGSRLINAGKMTQTGDVVNVLYVDNVEDDLILITNSGQVIRTPIAKIPSYSKSARGTRTMKLQDEAIIADSTIVVADVREESPEETEENGEE